MADESIILHVEPMTGESVRALVAGWDRPGADPTARAIAMRTIALDGGAKIDELTTERDRLRDEAAGLQGELEETRLDHIGAVRMHDQLAQDYVRVMDERDAAQALLVEEQRDHAATRERLKLAEIVCTLYGWTGRNGQSDREKAVLQAWMDWSNRFGSPKPSVEWDALIEQLARRRDEIRTATLARIRGEHVDVAAVDALPSPTPGSEDHPSGTSAAPGEESGT